MPNTEVKLADVFVADAAESGLQAQNSEEALRHLVSRLSELGALAPNQIGVVMKALLKREELGSTAIGKGIAVPHAKHGAVREITGAVARSPNGVPFNALDGNPVHIIFLLLSPPEGAKEHIDVLRKIIELADDDDMLRFLQQAEDDTTLVELMAEADERLAASNSS